MHFYNPDFDNGYMQFNIYVADYNIMHFYNTVPIIALLNLKSFLSTYNA